MCAKVLVFRLLKEVLACQKMYNCLLKSFLEQEKNQIALLKSTIEENANRDVYFRVNSNSNHENSPSEPSNNSFDLIEWLRDIDIDEESIKKVCIFQNRRLFKSHLYTILSY